MSLANSHKQLYAHIE
uniref:Uncharacterized protein n=1 Tax=Lepeophtheirus salmonis TaxID=72036 RepID=A0A0K2VI85_LEPSM